MTGPGLAQLAEKRTGYLELFFDLVFVFAVTQLVGLLHHDHTPGGWGRALLMAWMVWWAWSQYTWAGNAIDLDRRATRIALLVVTGVTLLTAQAMGDAFGEGAAGLRFALPYAAVRLAGLALYWAGSGAEQRLALRSYLPLAAVPPLVVLAGGLLPAGIRPWVWLAAVALDIASAVAGGRGEFRINPAHFAERHALFVIIALGESVVAVGATVAGLEPGALLAVTSLAAFAVVASQWWGYFDWVQEAAEERLSTEPDGRLRGRLARDLFTFGHFPIVGGAIVFAAGVEEAVLHPDRPLPAFGRAAVLVGLLLFLVGFVAGNARATHRLLVERTGAAVAVSALVVLAGPQVDAVVLLVVLAAVLVAVAGIETARRRTESVAT